MSDDESTGVGHPRVHRAPATARWTYNHRWGSQLGDNTELSVSRTDGGLMSVRYGMETFEIRKDLVARFAAMVAAAASWSDDADGVPGEPAPGGAS